jgi:hypothetical protein
MKIIGIYLQIKYLNNEGQECQTGYIKGRARVGGGK